MPNNKEPSDVQRPSASSVAHSDCMRTAAVHYEAPAEGTFEMKWIACLAALALIIVIFVDTFEAVILPRRIKHRYRLAPVFYQWMWILWRAIARHLLTGKWRNGFLSIFGPLSLFGLLSMWASGL